MPVLKPDSFRRLSPFLSLMVITAVYYLYIFIDSIPYWFDPEWTTDDALQQWFPLLEVLYPDRFKDDLIYQVMKGYLAPIQYYTAAFFTYLTGDLLMAAHWVMLVQIGLTCLFLYGAVHAVSGHVPAIFSLVWLIHSRQVMQRFTSGLPRGWSGVVIAAFFYFALKKNHTGVLVVLLLGCLAHPPTTMICAFAYGLWLVFGFFFTKESKTFKKPLLILILLSPLYLVVTYKVVERPKEIGQMVTLSEASKMPQFSRPDGRFPFLPHLPVEVEWKLHAFQPFIGRFYRPNEFLREHARTIVAVSFVLLVLVALVRRRSSVPLVLFAFFVSLTVIYFLSRPLAFKLYVPDRHLQLPMAFFWITAFPILIWNTFHRYYPQDLKNYSVKASYPAFIGLVFLGVFIYACSGIGLSGSLNFNYTRTKMGNVFNWVRKHTPTDSLIAGHPKFINGLMLFGERRGFATDETYHPFYVPYMTEIERRIEISFRAHYSKSLKEIYDLLAPEGIDYFIFDRYKFYPENLKAEEFYPPLDKLVKELTSSNPDEYAYKILPRELNNIEYPFLVFRDDKGVVIDIKQLGEWLALKQ